MKISLALFAAFAAVYWTFALISVLTIKRYLLTGDRKARIIIRIFIIGAVLLSVIAALALLAAF